MDVCTEAPNDEPTALLESINCPLHTAVFLGKKVSDILKESIRLKLVGKDLPINKNVEWARIALM